jgi:hypothetical protein
MLLHENHELHFESNVLWLGKYYRDRDPKEPLLLEICFLILDVSYLWESMRILPASCSASLYVSVSDRFVLPDRTQNVNETIAIISGSVLRKIKYKGSHSDIKK